MGRLTACLMLFIMVVVLWVGMAQCSLGGDVFPVRTLPDVEVATGSQYTTTISVTISGSPPSGVILQEVLPSGWTVVSATWNDDPVMPVVDGQTHKWLFGIDPPVGDGTLVYVTEVVDALECSYDIAGGTLYLHEGEEVFQPTTGDMTMYSRDQDTDGLPDDWETLYFGGPTNAVALEDPDTDGMTNLEEHRANTDPTNPASCFRIMTVSMTPSGCRVSFPSSASRYYTLQRRADLLIGDWTDVPDMTGVPGTGAILWLQDTNGGSRQFYRVEATLSP